MNDEQNKPEETPEANANSTAGNSTSATDEGFKIDEIDDKYYEVDNSKKDVISSVGDGEMRNEGIVGLGETVVENPFSGETPDEDDKPEF